MQGKCHLTHEFCDLRQSHIYPKFVVNWMKKTGSKYQRSYLLPNKRLQDGYKMCLLSENAEQLFSHREKWFAEHVFNPYLQDSSITCSYDENLFYFAVSVLWRILILELKAADINDFKYKAIMIETEEQWRNFLYRGIYPKDFDRIHLMLFDRIVSHTLPLEGVEYYFTRTMDGTTVYNEKTNKCAIYVKFARFAFWGFLSGVDDSHFQGTKINPIQGQMKMKGQKMDDFIYGFYTNRIALINSAPEPSEKQQEIIEQEIFDNFDHYKKAELFDIIEADTSFYKKNLK